MSVKEQIVFGASSENLGVTFFLTKEGGLVMHNAEHPMRSLTYGTSISISTFSVGDKFCLFLSREGDAFYSGIDDEFVACNSLMVTPHVKRFVVDVDKKGATDKFVAISASECSVFAIREDRRLLGW